MHPFIKLLYQVQLIPIREQDVLTWSKEGNTDKLILASTYGKRHIRHYALTRIRYLGYLNRKIRKHLIYLITEKDFQTADLAKEILVEKSMPRELEDDPDYQAALRAYQDKKEFLESKMQYFKESSSVMGPLRRDRTEMKVLNQVRKALQKPIK